jgi:hypothetical protein
LAKKAKAIAEEQGGELSPRSLRQSLERVTEDIARVRDRLKTLRLHHALGPQSLALLLADRKFRKALDGEGINVSKFEAVTQSEA